jgi:hypothetical protein
VSNLIYIILTGFLDRAVGWGTDNPRWKRLAEFFEVWTCAGLFLLLSALYYGSLVGAACGAAFIAYRLPGFNGWQNWGAMFLRGLWPTAIGFTLVAATAHAPLFLGLLCVPFAALYMLVYSGGYAWLPETILGLNRHVWIEHASGWLFGAFIVILNF